METSIVGVPLQEK